MSYCVKCGKEIVNGAAFCVGCGAPVVREKPVVTVQPKVSEEEFYREECEFIATTHKLLRWERKAWSIASKFWIIMGIVYAVIFSFYIFFGMGMSHYIGEFLIVFGVFAVLFFGGTFITLGIVNKKAAEKIVQYTDTIYTDFSLAYNRCANVGMLVFSVILGAVSPIFFIINFARMKTNREIIERIVKKQNIH